MVVAAAAGALPGIHLSMLNIHRISSAASERLEGEIKSLTAKLKAKNDEVKDLNASVAKLQAISASGADKDSSMMADMTAEVQQLK